MFSANNAVKQILVVWPRGKVGDAAVPYSSSKNKSQEKVRLFSKMSVVLQSRNERE